MSELETLRTTIQNVSKSGTKAEIIILVFSELDEKGRIKKCINFRYVQNLISKTAYYEGIRKLKEKGIVPKNELSVSENGTSVPKNELITNVSKNELNENVSQNELANSRNETSKKTAPDFNSFLNNQPTVSKSDTIKEVSTQKKSTYEDLLYTF